LHAGPRNTRRHSEHELKSFAPAKKTNARFEPGETDEACAVREVEEETGLRCALDDELPSVAYIDRKGRDKLVRYWAMHVLSGEAEPRNEVDAVRWVAVSRAARLLTHARDRVLVDAVTTNGEISA
jgi:8-oxo-dGTP diphosphatase